MGGVERRAQRGGCGLGRIRSDRARDPLKLVSRVKWEPLGTFFVAVGYVSDPMDVLLQYSDSVFAVVGCC